MDIKDIINEAKDYNPSEKDIILIGNLADTYKGKTDEDIFVEIIKVNDEMKEGMTEEEYDAIFQKLDSMRPILSGDQIAKLDMVLELLNKER